MSTITNSKPTKKENKDPEIDYVVNVSSSKQLEKILDKNKIVVIDFFATWCGPCKKISPFIHELARKYKNKILFIKIDVDECPEIAKEYEIEAMPTFIGIENGKVKHTAVGSSVNVTKMIEKLI